jgi:hypothetical protein
MEKLFLFKVYRHNKKLFFLFIAFAAFTLFCNLAGFEVTPFYVWGMYSQKETAPKNYTVYRVTANDKPIDYSTGYLPANRFFLISPLSYFVEVRDSTDPTSVFVNKKLKKKFSFIKPYALKVLNSKEDISEFPKWYKRYLQQTTGEKIKTLKVDVLQTSYTAHNSINIDSVYNLLNEQ